MSESLVSLRDEAQRETFGGILSRFQKFAAWAAQNPRRAVTGSVIGIAVLAFLVPLTLAVMMPERSFDLLDGILDSRLSEELLAAEAEAEADLASRQVGLELQSLLFRHGAGRAVIRIITFDPERPGQIVSIDDVFETQDTHRESLGLRERDLPADQINQTLRFMLSDTYNPRCIALNTQDYTDQGLRDFLTAGGFAASVACPIRARDRTATGLIAVSVMTPIEENPDLERDTRDTANFISGWIEESGAVKRLRASRLRRHGGAT
uniref:hypothetical protein n=1 Tax=uncultured Erythrobacter sp. TaxID=263913 RepID=UPI00261A9E01|nr:hypothetical protein [uncultured Erythrobacter sp.]